MRFPLLRRDLISRLRARLERSGPAPAALVEWLRTRVLDSYNQRAYAQEGEDLILAAIFADQPRGFYVDVGAHHPQRFSNTYRLYRLGWHGVNIDATPGSMAPFRRLRPRDCNLELAVAEQPGELLLYRFADPALNTFDPRLAAARAHAGHAPIAVQPVMAQPLATILGAYLPAGQSIDLLSVDVEGLDLGVLRSNDWERFPARCVLVECDIDLCAVTGHPVYQFLAPLGYRPVARTTRTLVLVRP